MLSWQGRFDDPRGYLPPEARFRTAYLARRRLTAFREVLQDLRPDTAARTEFRRLFGADPPGEVLVARWRADRRVGRARISAELDQIVNLDDPEVRRKLERTHAELLAGHGMEHLDIAEVRSKDRIVTQTIALDLWADGKAGVLYRSNVDDELCVAIFEGRTEITRYGPARPIPADHPDLAHVANSWELQVEPD